MLRPPEPDSVILPAIEALKGKNGNGVPSYQQVGPLVQLSMNAHRLTERDLAVIEAIIGKSGVQLLRRQIEEKVIRVQSA